MDENLKFVEGCLFYIVYTLFQKDFIEIQPYRYEWEYQKLCMGNNMLFKKFTLILILILFNALSLN